MTFEEMNPTIEFILQHEAQVSIHLEELAKNQRRHDELFAQMAVQDQRTGALLEIQSRRLDRAEKADREAQKRHDDFQKRYERSMEELGARLDRIIDKLS